MLTNDTASGVPRAFFAITPERIAQDVREASIDLAAFDERLRLAFLARYPDRNDEEWADLLHLRLVWARVALDRGMHSEALAVFYAASPAIEIAEMKQRSSAPQQVEVLGGPEEEIVDADDRGPAFWNTVADVMKRYGCDRLAAMCTNDLDRFIALEEAGQLESVAHRRRAQVEDE
jgi:hypothetical protein